MAYVDLRKLIQLKLKMFES